MESSDVLDIVQSLEPVSDASDLCCTHCRTFVFTDALVAKLTDLWERNYDQKGFTHEYMRDWHEICQAGKNGCSWCSELSFKHALHELVLKHSGYNQPQVLGIHMSFSIELSTQNGELEITAHAGKLTTLLSNRQFNVRRPATTYPIFPILHSGIDFASQECFRGIESFMRQCDRQHGLRDDYIRGEIETGKGLPIRVIDLTGEQPRITELDKIQLANVEYTALSYCWGTEQTYMLTSATIEQKRRALNKDQLPATIADAIVVTRRLGMRFLWVDALCIIQDDPNDKMVEIAKMKTIYQRARVTIAASRASSVHDRFLLKANALQAEKPSPLIVQLGEQNFKLVIGFERDKVVRPRPEPLDDRAWALQEHFMSDHLIIYSCHGVEMSCRNMHSTSDWTDFKGGWTRLTGNEWPENWWMMWWKLVEDYSRRKMAFASDKLIAISAIAQAMAQRLGGQYLAGLWQATLLADLQWAVCNPSPRPCVRGSATRTEVYRAPSWSWASCDDEVRWPQYWFETYIPFRNPRIVDYAITSLDPGFPFGAVTSGHVVLTCSSRTARLESAPFLGSYKLQHGENEAVRARMEIYNDYDTVPALEESIEVTFLALTINNVDFKDYGIPQIPIGSKYITGLILQAVEDGKWRRFGLFSRGPSLWFEDSTEREFHIV